MKIDDEGILLSLKKLVENSIIAVLLLRNHGIVKGVIKRTNNSKGTDLIAGNIFQANWYARLPEHLGSYRLEISEHIQKNILYEQEKIALISYILSLISASLPEHDPCPNFYDDVKIILNRISNQKLTKLDLLAIMIDFELLILTASGYRLSLEQCAMGGNQDNLLFISPKTGAAASEIASEYADKLFAFPAYFKNKEHNNDYADLNNALNITEHFLIKHNLLKESLKKSRAFTVKTLFK